MTTTTLDRVRAVPAGLDARLWRVATACRARLTAAGPHERGDVPGWVLVTLMSALLVVALIGVARTQLVDLFSNAINSVAKP